MNSTVFPRRVGAFSIAKAFPSHLKGRFMSKLIVGLLVLISTAAYADVSPEVQEAYKTFATRDLITFGAPKGTVLKFAPALQGYMVESTNLDGEAVTLGVAVVYQRCLVEAKGDSDVEIKCYQGISSELDLCKIDKKICLKDGVHKKLREVSVDPDIRRNGEVFKALGKRNYNAHMNGLTNLVVEYPGARKALAQAMALNDCTSIELGDVEGSSIHLEANPLADDDTKKVIPGASNRLRMMMKCRTAATQVYLDVHAYVEGDGIVQTMIPVKAAESAPVHIRSINPSGS